MELIMDLASSFNEVVTPISSILCGISAVFAGWLVYNELPEGTSKKNRR